jgi:hypothetical protein
MNTKHKVEFGDFQTPLNLATKVVSFIDDIFPKINVIVEPNCGIGNFLKASVYHWNNECLYFGFDINKIYINNLTNELKLNNCHLEVTDFFSKDWEDFFNNYQDQNVLVIGNPPWVTNSVLSAIKSNNLPAKSNFKKFKGLEAKLGKANFDIAEWMLINLINSLQKCNACIAMICKTSTARKVLKYFWQNNTNIYNSSIHLIDTKKYFNVSVDACLLIVHINLGKKSNQANVYSDLSFETKKYSFGLINNELISNLDNFYKYHQIDGICQYKWRSGVKHDAAKVMELNYDNKHYINGFGEIVDIENDYIYPLLKSSDLSNSRLFPSKFIVIPHYQDGQHISKTINNNTTKTLAYLNKYAHILDNRKSIIYKKRPQFSIFGIGDYSFTPWKVAISGFYKTITFSPIGSLNKKPIMLDDTCYFISCHSKEEADFIAQLLNSQPCQNFLRSLIFFDSKRPINIDILKRIDLKKLAEINHYSQ